MDSAKDRSLSPRRELAFLAALALGLLAGCEQAKAPWYSTQLAGSPAERARFVGSWYDEDGRMWAIVSDDPQPRLDLRPWGGRPITRIEHAQTAGDELHFSVLAVGDTPESSGTAVLQFTPGREGGDGEIHQQSDPGGTCCVCGCPVPSARLKHNPSPAWLGKIAARHTSEAIQKVREAVFDRLARVF